MEGGIFISYRRAEAEQWAARLRDHLIPYFGPERVYRDVDSNIPAHDWVERMDAALAASRAVLVLMGPNWATVTDAVGHRRLELSDDNVREEVIRSLRDKLVFPVPINNAVMPAPADLPEPLRPLTRLQAWPLTDQDWNYRVRLLIDELQKNGIKTALPGTSTPETSLLLTERQRVHTLMVSPERAFDTVYSTVSLMNYELLTANRETGVLTFTWGSQRGPLGKSLSLVTKGLSRREGVVAILRPGAQPGSTRLELTMPTASWMTKVLTLGYAIAWPMLQWALVRMFFDNVESVLNGQGLRYQSVNDFLKNRAQRGFHRL